MVAHRGMYLCASSLQNLAVRRSFYSSVSVDRSWRPCIRWCGTGGFQDQGQCFFTGLSCLLPFCLLLFFLFFFLSMGWYCGTGIFIDGVQIALFQPCIADMFFNNNNDNNVISHVFSDALHSSWRGWGRFLLHYLSSNAGNSSGSLYAGNSCLSL